MGDQIEVEPLPPDPMAEPSVSQAKTTKPDPELDQAEIMRLMEEVIEDGVPERKLGSETVQALLALKGPKGHKLVFTRYDLFQIFGIQQRKLFGEERL